MSFFLGFSFLFLVGALYNAIKGDLKEMAAGMALAGVFLMVHIARRQKFAFNLKALTAESLKGGIQRCHQCGVLEKVSLRAYYFTYSAIFYTSTSLGRFKPICDGCKLSAGLLYSLGTLLSGWWGFPWGPIHTVRSIHRNFNGGVVHDTNDESPAPDTDEIVS